MAKRQVNDVGYNPILDEDEEMSSPLSPPQTGMSGDSYWLNQELSEEISNQRMTQSLPGWELGDMLTGMVIKGGLITAKEEEMEVEKVVPAESKFDLGSKDHFPDLSAMKKQLPSILSPKPQATPPQNRNNPVPLCVTMGGEDTSPPPKSTPLLVEGRVEAKFGDTDFNSTDIRTKHPDTTLRKKDLTRGAREKKARDMAKLARGNVNIPSVPSLTTNLKPPVRIPPPHTPKISGISTKFPHTLLPSIHPPLLQSSPHPTLFSNSLPPKSKASSTAAPTNHRVVLRNAPLIPPPPAPKPKVRQSSKPSAAAPKIHQGAVNKKTSRQTHHPANATPRPSSSDPPPKPALQSLMKLSIPPVHRGRKPSVWWLPLPTPSASYPIPPPQKGTIPFFGIPPPLHFNSTGWHNNNIRYHQRR